MNVEELFASFEALIEANRPARDDVVYLARSGDDYDWCIIRTDGATGAIGDPIPQRGRSGPDTWMSFSADWPKNREELRAFVADLLAELESMAAGADRCRWPVGEPWPRAH